MSKKNKKEKTASQQKTQSADSKAQATNLLEHPCSNGNCKKNRLFDFD